MVWLTIRNVADKAIGLIFCRKVQLFAEALCAVFEKVVHSNDRSGALDRLVIQLHAVRITSGSGGVKAIGRPLSVMAHLKKSIVEINAENNCLAHALVIVRARIEGDRNYDAYRRGSRIFPAVGNLLQSTGIDLQNGRGIAKLVKFQEYLK
jgi:hypothetical protein